MEKASESIKSSVTFTLSFSVIAKTPKPKKKLSNVIGQIEKLICLSGKKGLLVEFIPERIQNSD